MKTISIP